MVAGELKRLKWNKQDLSGVWTMKFRQSMRDFHGLLLHLAPGSKREKIGTAVRIQRWP